MRAFGALVALTLLAALAIPAAATASYRAKCIPRVSSSGKCTWWKAKVKLVADGDTVQARVEGGPTQRIRFTGINAMELHRYSHYADRRRGDCHGVAATNFTESYIKKARGHVRLAAQHPSSRSGKRLRRSVWVKSHGRLVDLSRLELEAGYALWLPNGKEWVHNRDYAELAAQAVAAQRNLYDPDSCGRGPSEGTPVSVVVNWDADGADSKNRNGEWADIRNHGTEPLSLRGWFFRDSALRGSSKRTPPGYEFPASAVVPPGGSLRLHVGCGHNTATDLHWCQPSASFENVTRRKAIGDGGYLFDPDRDLRASFLYPCRYACEDPASGKVRLVAFPTKPESIALVNIGDVPLDLSDHVLKLRNHGRAGEYVFGDVFRPGTVLGLGPVNLVRYVPPTDNRFSDKGGVVELRTLDDQLTSCVDWGFGRC